MLDGLVAFVVDRWCHYRSARRGDAITIEPSNVPNCVSKGKSEHYDCRNHIRVIQPIGDGNRLYVCGTNAHNPMDYVIHANLTRLAKHEYFPGIGDGIAKCPFDPEDNATAVWVEHGNPSGLAGLYSGTVAEFTKADTVIFRTNLYNLTTRMELHPFKRTIKYDSKWLDKPNFVGSYDIGEHVYFFFRESAVEYINCGKSIYSRVARVCKPSSRKSSRGLVKVGGPCLPLNWGGIVLKIVLSPIWCSRLRSTQGAHIEVQPVSESGNFPSFPSGRTRQQHLYR
ncbi:semaphorin-2A [Trichonephila clavipes]|nr:semaphorin-2A [Trichonephila clavipes]